ncbi:cation diffusion facilitator family transporter [Sphingomonas immobilis]|uniref:Cation diffusion facilitator family transporter n=1 Tax=Sphingomonas immobilis TaxID=3063997 RepID=A0ABT8ZZV5_9SPHN|nr:cation diffusion facilitator family transporter [Sphingomonas sp. CA1-15]MDO7843099.1 cation diffusion facilitator family transporter [Sphingomonas sp. CA1-15]
MTASATRAALASVGVATLLLLVKGVAAYRTGSVAMLGSVADTGLDLLASLVTLWGVRVAATPADDDHRFGHGKAEALAALFQVMVISASAAAIAWEAVARIGHPAPTAAGEYGICASILAIALTGALIAYQRRVIASTGSVAITADSIHYSSDLLLNGAVIVALLLDQWLGLHGADPLFGVLIALWLAYGAWRAANHAIDQLMDKEWPAAERDRLIALAADHPELRGLHDIRTRRSGNRDFVQFHMAVDPEMPVAAAHLAMDEVEERIHAAFPNVEVLIHLDPGWRLDAKHPLIETDLADNQP